jgi:hypothetical protein
MQHDPQQLPMQQHGSQVAYSCHIPTLRDESSQESKPEVRFKKPAVVFVPAAFAPKSLYDSLLSILLIHNYDVHFPELSSVIPREVLPEDRPRAATLEDDISCVRRVVIDLANTGKDILLVGHGYGALPASECCRSLTKLERTTRGQRGGIVGLLYISGLIPSFGQNILDLFKEMLRDPTNQHMMVLDVGDLLLLLRRNLLKIY